MLVATSIIAFALAAAVQVAGSNAANLSYLRDKTFAHWVAMNQMAELEISGEFPSVGRSSGEEEMGNREWYWTAEVKETPDEDIRRVEISIRAEDSSRASVLATLTGYFTRYDEATQTQ